MLRITIVEDLRSAQEQLTQYIARYCQEIGQECSVSSYSSAIPFLESYGPGTDVVLMDIHMPGMDGMEAARRLREMDKTVVLIFVTTLAQYAARGYQVDALDFMVKPFSYQDFSLRFRRALERAAANRKSTIRIRIPGGFYATDSSRLLYVEVCGHDLLFHMTDDTVKTRGSMTDMEKELAPMGFLRCNACYLVNPRHVVRVQNMTVTVGQDELKISKAKKQLFMEQLTEWFGAH